jgi:hypothetical protein
MRSSPDQHESVVVRSLVYFNMNKHPSDTFPAVVASDCALLQSHGKAPTRAAEHGSHPPTERRVSHSTLRYSTYGSKESSRWPHLTQPRSPLTTRPYIARQNRHNAPHDQPPHITCGGEGAMSRCREATKSPCASTRVARQHHSTTGESRNGSECQRDCLVFLSSSWQIVVL